MKVKIKYNDSFDDQDCVEVLQVPEFTGVAIAQRMQEKMQDETGLAHTYTLQLFEVVNERDFRAVFHIVYKDVDNQTQSDLTGTAFLLHYV